MFCPQGLDKKYLLVESLPVLSVLHSVTALAFGLSTNVPDASDDDQQLKNYCIMTQ